LRERADAMKSVWQKERQIIAEIRKIKEEIESTRTEAELAQRKGDFTRAGELRFGRLPELEKRMATKNEQLREAQKGGAFLREEVTEEDIAAVVSKWTGIPVDKMLEGEQSRLSGMEERLHRRVIGQDEAVTAVPTPSAGRAPACRTPTAPSARSSSWARRAWGRPSWRARWPTSSSTTRRTSCASTCPSTWRSTPWPA
jgi:ATP-dependent Clp protease ATP-binding subunit ClpB